MRPTGCPGLWPSRGRRRDAFMTGAGRFNRSRAATAAGRLVAAALLWLLGPAATALEPIADAHVHYKWSQLEVTTPRQAVEILEEAGVELALVFGTPPELALRLHELAPQRVIPLYGPYDGRRDWVSWQFDPALVADARKALESGVYRGIGEMHLIGGFSSRLTENPVLEQMMALGAELDAPLIIHSEFSSPRPFLELCRRHPETPVILAHAGTVIPPPAVREILEACPRVVAELAARDPWRYVKNPIADPARGALLPEWEALVLDYPERFVVGSDNVWPVERLDGWDQPDSGWQELERFLDFHRRWLSRLPPEVAAKVRYENVRRLFGPRS